jgi:hypothetical protein
MIPMCRSIKVLRRPGPPATPEESQAAALQFVRKISGYRKPAARNQAAFDRAVAEVAEASQRLLESISSQHSLTPPDALSSHAAKAG